MNNFIEIDAAKQCCWSPDGYNMPRDEKSRPGSFIEYGLVTESQDCHNLIQKVYVSSCSNEAIAEQTN